MRKTFLASFLFAFLACISVRAEVTPWFSENADSFQLNANRRWHYTPGAADAEGGWIRAHYVEGFTRDRLETRYNPAGVAATAVVSNEFEMCFSALGDETKDSLGSIIGVQVVEGYYDYHAFAVLLPEEGSAAWKITDVPAETNVTYRITAVITYTPDGGFIRYSAAAEGCPKVEIADVPLPKNVAKPAEYVMYGDCQAREISAWLEGEAIDAYCRWRPLNAAFTWRGGVSVLDGDYDIFDLEHGVDLGFLVETGRVFSAALGGLYQAPGCAIRFTNGVEIVAGASPMHFGGMIVEPGADGLKITGAGELAFGDETLSATTYFRFLSDTTLGASGDALAVYGDCTIEVAEGKTLDMSAAATLTLNAYASLRFAGGGTVKLPVDGMVATGPVSIDYTATTSSFKLLGKLTVDGSTAFGLPAGVPEGGTGYKLVNGTVAGGDAPVRRAVKVGEDSFVADTTISSDGTLVYHLSAHGDWKAYPAVFNWEGGDTFATGKFRLFDCTRNVDTDTVFYGGKTAEGIPGWGDASFRNFNSVFCDRAGDGLPLCRDAGYVLRFVADSSIAKEVNIDAGSPVFGGLLVEPGAVGYSIVGEADESESLRFAGPSATSTNRVEINEDFAIDRTAPVAFFGRSHLQVAAGKTLSLGAVVVDAAGAPRRDRPYLSLAGDGTLVTTGMVTVGAVTLDFSGAARGASDTALIDGPLTVSPETRLVLPAGLAAGTEYPLCTGDLTMDSGARAVAFGDGEFAIKNVTVSGGKISWADATVNARTLSADANWSSFGGTFTAGQPVVLTLTKDVKLNIDSTGQNFPALLVLGDCRLQIVMTKNATFTNVYLGRGTRCEYVYNMNCASFSSTFTVPAGTAYDTAIEGAAGNQTTWNKGVTVLGHMTLRNRINLSHGDTSVTNFGTVLVDTGANASLAGKENSLMGVIEIAAGATLKPTVSQNFSHNGNELRLKVKGTLDLDVTQQTLGPGSVWELHGGSVVSCGAENTNAVSFLTAANVHVYRGSDDQPAELSASVVCAEDARLLVEAGATLQFDGVADLQGGVFDPSGAGSVKLVTGASLAFTNDFFCTGGLVGSGTAYFYSDPSRSLAGPSLMDGAWTGEVRLYEAELVEFDPARCGNPDSTIAFDRSYGYFAKNVASTAPFKMIPQASTNQPSLDVTSGYDDSGESVPRIFDSGLLRLSDDGIGNYRHRFFIDRTSDYYGSFAVNAGVLGGIVLGTTDYSGHHEEFDSVNDGRLSIVAGTVTIAESAWWNAAGGIRVDENVALVDSGTIQSPVIGTGVVQYYGDLTSDRPELEAKYDQPEWKGTVEFYGGTFAQRDLLNSGNANSRIRLDGVVGSLAPQVNEACLILSGKGFGADSAVDHGLVQFRKLMGDASLRIETGSKGPGSWYRFCDVEDFTGRFVLDTETTAVAFGEDADRLADATLNVGDVRMHSKMDWRVPYAEFGKHLTLIGATEDDDILEAFKATYVYLDHTRVDIVDGIGIDARINHGLGFDGSTKKVFLVRAETPPTMDIGDINIRYGVDFTNATITLTVSNFWAGYEFNGLTYADVKVYNSDGKLVGAGDCLVDGDGVFVIGGASLPFGRGADYHYDVGVRTEQRTTGEINERGDSSVNAAGVHWSGDWFAEDAESFAAEAPSALKTGDWIYDEGAVATNDEQRIAFNTVEVSATSFAKFEPYRGVSNDYVRVHYGDVTFDTMFDFGAGDGRDVDIGGGFAAITLACDYGGAEPVPYFAVWVCDGDGSTSGRFERVSSSVSPAMGEMYSIDCTINRDRRTIGYSVNGLALTNGAGRAFFPLPDTVATNDYSLLFKGTGKVADLYGDQNNDNLAAVVNGARTNEYATVDEAVAAATNAGDRVALLWDASWRPKTEDVGRTIRFANGDYILYVDQATTNQFAGGGYRFIDNQDGSYTVGVIEYELSFQPNDATGTMAPQKFSVTNMVFNLISNAFVRTGSDFSHWNDKSNGRGLHSWTDGAEIDMTEFGLTNKTIYAQWTIAVKTIIIEAADEYVYVERITTNGLDLAGVKYVGHADDAERAKGRGSVEIRATYGSTLVVRFSTDVGKLLTTPDWKIDPGYRQYSEISNSFRVANVGVNLPHYSNVGGGEAPEPLSEVGAWAIVHGIPIEAAAASPFALASCQLNMNSLLTEDTEVVISDFRTTADRCTFQVTIDGKPLEDASLIKPMIQVSGDLCEWAVVDSDKVSVDAAGRVTVETDSDASFVKILIPKSK